MNALTWTLIAMIFLALAGTVGLIWVRVKNANGNGSAHDLCAHVEGESTVDRLTRNVDQLESLIEGITTRLPPRKGSGP